MSRGRLPPLLLTAAGVLGAAGLLAHGSTVPAVAAPPACLVFAVVNS
ncbi:hypothetical protein [Streptomyces sp. NPDC096105]